MIRCMKQTIVVSEMTSYCPGSLNGCWRLISLVFGTAALCDALVRITVYKSSYLLYLLRHCRKLIGRKVCIHTSSDMFWRLEVRMPRWRAEAHYSRCEQQLEMEMPSHRWRLFDDYTHTALFHQVGSQTQKTQKTNSNTQQKSKQTK